MLSFLKLRRREHGEKPSIVEAASTKDKYELQSMLGEGGFGTVFDAVDDSKKPCIIKRLPLEEGSNEVCILKSLVNIPGVITYIDHFYSKYFLYIVLEKIENVIDLYDFISSHVKLTEAISKIILSQLINILIWCKNNNIIHNDIKDENILIDPRTHQITLIDFGAADIWDDDKCYTHHYGTKVYCCPEWFLDHQYTAHGMTTWSIGILLYNMLFGNIPFHSSKEIMRGILPPLDGISRLASNLLQKCLAKTSSHRPKINHLLYHSWFYTDSLKSC
jgi:serine/threonine protein kinase